MNVPATALPNSKAVLEEQLQAGRIAWTWPVIVVFARLVFAVLAQALVAELLVLRGDPTPWQTAAPWWTVYGTSIDVGCLVLLARLARREGIRLPNLIGFQRGRLGRDLLLGLGVLVLLVIMGLLGDVVFVPLIYGAAPAPAPMGGLPVVGALYSVLIWPLIWAIAEETTYQGYALPRLEVLSGRAWLAVLIVSFGWAVQHCALPLLPDWRWALFRFASSLPFAIVLPIIYLRTRRLPPIIAAHWAANAVSALTLVLLPLMER
jgi:membrane protease YdiL (CAAX protease family)